ncbi:hypothetical protein BH10PSE19_BH10PSE19_16340 [soil metagenome]
MHISTLTQKGQATIPVEIRNALELHTGDKIDFTVVDGYAVLKKVQPFDVVYHQNLESTLSEWASAEDDEAYADL